MKAPCPTRTENEDRVLTHAVTHEQKKRGGNSGTKRIHGCGNPAAKPPKSSETVYKASLSNLHTHEATGSSPVVSTKNHRNRLIPVIFFYNLQLFWTLNFRRFFKTHTLTHTGKGPESTGQGQTGIFLSGPVQSVKKLPKRPCFWYNKGNGGVFMENWRKDARHEPIIVDLEALVPKEHLLRKIEKVMDYEWLYERLDPYYCHDNGRPGTDPVVLIKMVLIQHLFGIPSLRQTYREIQVNVAYRWFLGYGLLDNIPHFATVSYAFCKRFPDELTSEIFEHILNKALNNRMLDTSAIFIDGTHIKASANKKKFQKEQVAKAARVYSGQLRREVNEEREKLGKKPIEDDDDENQGSGGSQETAEKTVSTTDPDCGMFVKGEHERQFAYEAHTACDKHGFVLGVEVTSGNVSDSVAWDAVYDKVTDRFPEVKFVTMDAGYKTPWIAKKVIEDSRIPILPYTRYKGKKDTFKPWDFTYNVVNDSFVCPGGHELRHTTTSKDGKRTYRSATQVCKDCPCRSVCGANENGQRMLTTHIWQEFLDLVEQLRKTERGKEIYAMRKQTIERVFADAKEKHAMRYTHHRGLARVSAWVRLKYAAMNLKKLALWKWSRSDFFVFLPYFFFDTTKTPALA